MASGAGSLEDSQGYVMSEKELMGTWGDRRGGRRGRAEHVIGGHQGQPVVQPSLGFKKKPDSNRHVCACVRVGLLFPSMFYLKYLMIL